MSYNFLIKRSGLYSQVFDKTFNLVNRSSSALRFSNGFKSFERKDGIQESLFKNIKENLDYSDNLCGLQGFQTNRYSREKMTTTPLLL